MKNILIIIFLWAFLLNNLYGQEPANKEYGNTAIQDSKQVEYKKNSFELSLDMPGLFFSSGFIESNVLHSVGIGFDYNFSEVISLGLHASFYYNHSKYTESAEEWKHQKINLSPVFKINLGRNQIFVPFLEASYTLSLGKWYCNYNELYTPNYIRHIVSGGIGVKLYASRWFKKTKYKNNFGIECCISKAFFLFDNSINIPLDDRSGIRGSIFYRF